MSQQFKRLPDPLTFTNGWRVETVDQWERLRKPELRRLFESEMYGRAPKPVRVTREVLSSAPLPGFAGHIEQWRVRIHSPKPHVLEILLALPPIVSKPVPAILALNFHGNHTVIRHPAVVLPNGWVPRMPFSNDHRASDMGRGREASDWAVEQAVRAGFALVTAHYGAIEPDVPDGVGGIREAFGGSYSWGAVSAWAWGLSRIFDVVAEDRRVDEGRIAVAGHSRLGKAALLAAAFDERFAMVAPVQAGCGGTAPSRGTVGESVRDITSAFPHWFAPRFREYADRVSELPFDQNALMAMVAPRPLLLANAEEDLWANPEGQRVALEDARRAYDLYGLDGEALGGYWIRPGGHRMTADDWRAVIEFAKARI